MLESSTIVWDVKKFFNIFALLRSSPACSLFIINIGIFEDSLFKLSTWFAAFQNSFCLLFPWIEQCQVFQNNLSLTFEFQEQFYYASFCIFPKIKYLQFVNIYGNNAYVS